MFLPNQQEVRKILPQGVIKIYCKMSVCEINELCVTLSQLQFKHLGQ